MHLKWKVQYITKDKIEFSTKDLGDKTQVKLHVNGKKVDSGYVMKGEKSNTTFTEMEEALLLTYCRGKHINV